LRDTAIPPFRAYIFDIDGTLLDSAEDICGAVSTVLARTTRPEVEFAYLKSFIGRHLTDLFEELFPEATPAQIEAWIQEYRTLYPERGHRSTRLYPGVEETIRALGGVKTTATTKSTLTATNILTQFGLRPEFAHIQGTDGFPSKPKPDVLYRALDAIRIPAEECLFIGDSVPDMVAGKAAGVKVCAVSYGYGKPQELRDCQPDYWADDIRALLAR
jgi:phosphoglycolate phosphatase